MDASSGKQANLDRSSQTNGQTNTDRSTIIKPRADLSQPDANLCAIKYEPIESGSGWLASID